MAFRVPERPVSNQPNITGDVLIDAFDHVATIVNIPPGSFPLIGPDTFLANITGSSAPPVQQLLTTLAGSFLTYIPGTGVIDWDGVAVQKAGAPAGTQRTLNIIEGANITATVVNNTVTGAVDITLASTGGSGSAQSWAGTLEVSKFSGPWNPHIDAPQYISFGVEDAIPGVGHLRFSQDCHIEANFDGYFHVLGSLFLGGHASPNDATTIASDIITFDATDSLIGLSGDIMSLVSTNSAVVQSTASTLSLSGQTGATLTAQTGNAGISATTGLAAVTGSTQVQIVSAADVVCASLDDFRVMTGSPFTQRFQIDEFGAIGLGSAAVIGPAGHVITSQGPGAPPVWAAVDLSSVTYTAGDGINLSGNVFSVDATDIVDGVSIVEVATNNIQRAALTGFITASQGQNTTTSAEPLVTFGSSSNMTNERVLTAGANVSISTVVAGLIVVSATNTDTTYTAGDGIDLASNVFSVDVSDFAGTGLEDDGANNLRIAAAAAGDGLTGGAGSALAVGGSTSIIVGADDVQRAAITGFATAAQNSNVTSSAEPIVTFSASSNMSNERILSNGANTTINTTIAGQIRVDATDTTYSSGDSITISGGGNSVNYTGNATVVEISGATSNLGTIDISALTCGGSVRVTSASSAFSIEGFTAKSDGFWFYFEADLSTTNHCTLFHEDLTATAGNRLALPFDTEMREQGRTRGIFFYRNTRWNWCSANPQVIGLSPTNYAGFTDQTGGFEVVTSVADIIMTAGFNADVVLNAGGNVELNGDDIRANSHPVMTRTGGPTVSIPAGTTNNLVISTDTVALRRGAAVGTSTVTGITGGVNGRLLQFFSVDGSAADLCQFAHDDSGSVAENRIYCPGNTNFSWRNRGGGWLRYDGGTSRWIVLAP